MIGRRYAISACRQAGFRDLASLPALPLLQSEAIPQKDDPLFGAALDQLPASGKTATQPHVQTGGRKAAIALLTSFLRDRSQFYIKNLASPSQGPDTSMRLSPHLAWGTMSSREVEASIRNYLANPENDITPAKRRGCRAVMSRLAWRCHFMQKLEDQPDIEWAAMHPLYETVRDDTDEDASRKAAYLAAWKAGQTGYPMIDACMRSLNSSRLDHFSDAGDAGQFCQLSSMARLAVNRALSGAIIYRL